MFFRLCKYLASENILAVERLVFHFVIRYVYIFMHFHFAMYSRSITTFSLQHVFKGKIWLICNQIYANIDYISITIEFSSTWQAAISVFSNTVFSVFSYSYRNTSGSSREREIAVGTRAYIASVSTLFHVLPNFHHVCFYNVWGNTGKNAFYFFYKITRRKLTRPSLKKTIRIPRLSK